MAFQPERPLSDPLLEPPSVITTTDVPDTEEAPSRTTIGNSARTLLLVGALIAVGIAVWWIRRPIDLTQDLGGREWVIIEFDGEPATASQGRASTFVLDGTHEFRAMESCNTVTGRWQYDTSERRLEIEPESTTASVCDADSPITYGLASGRVALNGELEISTGAGEIVAIAPEDLAMAEADDLAGRWTAADLAVEFGPRGLLRVGECTGSWTAAGGGIAMQLDREDPSGCATSAMWSSGETVIPVRHGAILLLRLDRPMFPLDRDVVRLDAVQANGSPLLDGP